MQIRDTGWKNSDPGSGINIPDPQLCLYGTDKIQTQIFHALPVATTNSSSVIEKPRNLLILITSLLPSKEEIGSGFAISQPRKEPPQIRNLLSVSVSQTSRHNCIYDMRTRNYEFLLNYFHMSK
jgi:hypothetical protein